MTQVLIVDDNEANRYLLETLLRASGFTAVCTADGQEALAAAEANLPDLIVSDVLMPGQTGPELASALRLIRPDLKVVFVTGFTGDIASAAAFGNDTVLRKPFTIAALGSAVDTALVSGATTMLETRAAA